jgi:phosphatidylethanolamine/phosphatidyl-N-methylethanolamine N-methyltransferase
MKTRNKSDRGDKNGKGLKHIGRIIEDHFKKSVNKVEEVFKDSKSADDKLFSYFKVFMDDKGVASVTPSSKYIVDKVIKAMDLKTNKIVIEYGAADGPMTKRIIERLHPDGNLVAIELNETLHEKLRKLSDDRRFHPVQGDVRQVEQIAARYGIARGQADVIISGIPFAFLSGRGRHELLLATSELLRPGGRFIAYQVTTHLIPLLKDYFARVDTQFEVRNIPPHFVFTAYK